MKNVCVYCSSSDKAPGVYFKAAEELGGIIVKEGYGLYYGGGDIGLMGIIARAVQKSGGRVHGVIPKSLNIEGIAYRDAEELIVTKDLRERKAVMEKNAEGFIAMAGGFGTVEEICEVITLKQLGLLNKPIVFLNTNNFFGKLFEFFDLIFSENFAKEEFRELYYAAEKPADAVKYIKEYTPFKHPKKWF